MSRLKALGAVTGITLLVLAAALIYVAGRNLLELRPADSYQDAGVHTFVAYRVLPSQVPNTGASGRDRRMNPTKTIYKVHYLATDGSGYQWSEQVLTESIGQDMVDAETTVGAAYPCRSHLYRGEYRPDCGKLYGRAERAVCSYPDSCRSVHPALFCDSVCASSLAP